MFAYTIDPSATHPSLIHSLGQTNNSLFPAVSNGTQRTPCRRVAQITVIARTHVFTQSLHVRLRKAHVRLVKIKVLKRGSRYYDIVVTRIASSLHSCEARYLYGYNLRLRGAGFGTLGA